MRLSRPGGCSSIRTAPRALGTEVLDEKDRNNRCVACSRRRCGSVGPVCGEQWQAERREGHARDGNRKHHRRGDEDFRAPHAAVHHTGEARRHRVVLGAHRKRAGARRQESRIVRDACEEPVQGTNKTTYTLDEATVAGRKGGLILEASGIFDGDVTSPAGSRTRFHFTIRGVSGDLKGATGTGQFVGGSTATNSFNTYYAEILLPH